MISELRVVGNPRAAERHCNDADDDDDDDDYDVSCK